MQPFVSVGMIEMPMRVDQGPNGIGTNFSERVSDSRSRSGDTRIYEHLAVAASEHGNISAGTLNYADIASQLLDRDFCGGGCPANDNDGTLTVSEQTPRQEKCHRRPHSSACEEMTTGESRCSVSFHGNLRQCSAKRRATRSPPNSSTFASDTAFRTCSNAE